MIQRYRYADERTPYMVEQEGKSYYLIYNHQGSLKAVMDETGKIVKALSYDTFGRITDDTNADFVIAFGFAGGLYDKETKLKMQCGLIHCGTHILEMA